MREQELTDHIQHGFASVIAETQSLPEDVICVEVIHKVVVVYTRKHLLIRNTAKNAAVFTAFGEG